MASYSFFFLPRFEAVPALPIFSTPFLVLVAWQPFEFRLFDKVSNTSRAPFNNQPIEGELTSFLVTGSFCIVVPINVVDLVQRRMGIHSVCSLLSF